MSVSACGYVQKNQRFTRSEPLFTSKIPRLAHPRSAFVSCCMRSWWLLGGILLLGSFSLGAHSQLPDASRYLDLNASGPSEHSNEDEWKSYGEEPPQYKKQFLIKRLAYRIQELFYGGLSEQAKVHLQQAAKEDAVATVNRRIPEERKSNEAILPGTRLVRIWNDRRYEVIVLADGYEFEGRTFRSLSAVAREITGTRWNGKVFFGLKKVYGRKAEGGSDA